MTMSGQWAAWRIPGDVLARFRLGQDTATIAAVLRVPEHVVCWRLDAEREAEWARKQEEACAAWNDSLEPVEVRDGRP
jgi:hypothetical protein